MARKPPTDPYETDKEKRDLAEARAAALKAKTTQSQADPYTQKFGYPNLDTMTAAETSRERAATNDRLTQNAATNSKIEALKALSITGAGSPHGQAALDELAKIAGVKVPKQAMDPKTAAMNKLRAQKGLPPLGGDEAPQPGDTTGLVAPPPQQNQSIFQPVTSAPEAAGPAAGTVPVPAGSAGEPSYGKPITPHLGTGGAEITPENPTGQPHNPWGAGGLLDNPTHAAAQNVQAREAAVHPFGSDNSPLSQTYFPGEAMDRLATNLGGVAPAGPTFRPTGLVTTAPLRGRNVPPNENVLPAPVNTWQREGNVLPPPPTAAGWNANPGGTLGQDWLEAIRRRRELASRVPGVPAYQ